MVSLGYPGIETPKLNPYSEHTVNLVGDNVDLVKAQEDDPFCSNMRAYLSDSVTPTDDKLARKITRLTVSGQCEI
jgi:hypothetical protein